MSLNAYKNTELRKLPADTLCQVVDILEINDDWKRFMSIIPDTLQTESSKRKYNNEHTRLIEDYGKTSNLKCTEILLEEWGTSGRVRPTLTHLKALLVKAKMFRAADEICKMLGEPIPERPSDGPGATITTNVTDLLNDESMQQRFNDMSSFDKEKNNEFGNKITKQMKPASNMTYPEFNKENISNKTTAQMKPDSDLIQFPTDGSNSYMPDFNYLLNNHNTESGGQSVSNESNESNVSKSNEIAIQNSNAYQTSFPNIEIWSTILEDTKLIHFKYKELETLTDNFSEKGKIGSGGFGDVFVGSHSQYGLLAIKKAHSYVQLCNKPDIAMTLFNSEVKYLSKFRHINIVPIIGFSKDGPLPCIVCEYITGGSLEQNIEKKILNESQRMNIITGTAAGLKYLHTSEKSQNDTDGKNIFGDDDSVADSQNTIKNFVHGDVKTANILLTKDFVPKLCDFGLAKQFDSTFVTLHPMGTSIYMAPEGHQGTITQKIDIYSYGVVLLELLTGLKPKIVKGREILSIYHYIEENIVNNDISPLVDPVVNSWTKANEIYSLAKRCLEPLRKYRPNIEEVVNELDRIKQ